METMVQYDQQLNNKLKAYYANWYAMQGHEDATHRIDYKMREDDNEVNRIRKIEAVTGLKLADFQRHLIVGVGTGGLVVALKKIGVQDVAGFDPSDAAIEIAKQKARLVGVNDSQILNGVAEKIPFENETFDFVHCVTVLEHVQDVRLSVREMYRVLKPGGTIYIHTPNYRYPYEPHYKIPAPTQWGRFWTKLYFKLKGLPVSFVDSLNLFSEKQLNKILKSEVKYFYRVYKKNSDSAGVLPNDSFKMKLLKRYLYHLIARKDIYKNQEIIIRKLKNSE